MCYVNIYIHYNLQKIYKNENLLFYNFVVKNVFCQYIDSK